ncbi:potassium channel family protein [Clostridium estertheticum]|uniref:potassium channel family protein n=1 Tax=Clostridium estertheticum TaxID=238834 RepID=UPI001C7DC824|nr:potassium channel family protein [Clostridium estertheticum]MBX4272101.1 potassium channel family protein [Clostridium estertheticum]WLC78896.1 potassium channel family protein [Clostridium estertheticum]
MYNISVIRECEVNNGRISFKYLDTERYKRYEDEPENNNEFKQKYCEHSLIEGHEFKEMFLKDSKIELRDTFVDGFTIGRTSRFIDDDYEVPSEKSNLSLKMTDCFLYGNSISRLEDFKIKKLILEQCIINVGTIDFINLSMDENSQFEFNNCKFINTELNFRNFIMENGHFTIADCKFSNSLIQFEAKITNSNVFIINNSFVESRFYINDSYFTNAAIKISGDFKYSLDIFLQTVYSNNSYLDFKINNISMRDKNTFEFEDINFEGGKLNFEYSNLYNTHLIFKRCKLNTFLNISVDECKGVSFNNSTINSGIIKIDVKNGCEELSVLELLNVGVIDIDWDKNNVYDAIVNRNSKSYYDLAKQFLILKDSYNKLGYYEYEDKSYIIYKRYQLKAEYIEGTKNISTKKRIFNFIQYHLKRIFIDFFSEFGMNPKRIVLLMLVIIGLYSLIYSFLPIAYFAGLATDCNNFSKIYNSMYFSGITFLTIGYGDIHPLNIAKAIAVSEGFFGVLSMSYFVVTFSRKIIR